MLGEAMAQAAGTRERRPKKGGKEKIIQRRRDLAANRDPENGSDGPNLSGSVRSRVFVAVGARQRADLRERLADKWRPYKLLRGKPTAAG
jgi:hypothetical protein